MSDVYQPSEDTALLIQTIASEKGNWALDVGTGSGIIASILQQNFRFVVGTDISFNSLVLAKQKIDRVICCNAADSVMNTFDLIVCNMPYLPSVSCSEYSKLGHHAGSEIKEKVRNPDHVCVPNYFQKNKILDPTVDGGPQGIEVPLKILSSVRRLLLSSGKFVFVTSTLSSYEKLLSAAHKMGFNTKILENKQLFFERLLVVEATI